MWLDNRLPFIYLATADNRADIVEHVCWTLCGQKTGFTPLYLAAQENGADIVDMLLQAGADQRIHTVSCDWEWVSLI